MKRGSRGQDSDSFGRPVSGSIRGLDAPMIGAPSAIIVDGLVEQEEGVTPAPPGITVGMIVVAIGAMFALGLLASVLFLSPRPLPAGFHADLRLEMGSRFEFTSEPEEFGEVETWYAEPGPDTVFLLDGAEVTASEFVEAFPPERGLHVSVTASKSGTIDRVDAATGTQPD